MGEVDVDDLIQDAFWAAVQKGDEGPPISTGEENIADIYYDNTTEVMWYFTIKGWYPMKAGPE